MNVYPGIRLGFKISCCYGQRVSQRLQNLLSMGLVAGLSVLGCNQAYAAPSAVGGGILHAGMDGEYFNNTELSGTPAFERHDVRVDFDWNSVLKPGGSLSEAFSSIGNDNYSVRWTGQISGRFSETYTFKAIADDGVRVYIKPAANSTWTTLINQWNSAGTYTADYDLIAGEAYDFKIEYRELTGNARISLLWSSASTPEEVIDVATNLGNIGPSYSIASADAILSATNFGFYGDYTSPHGNSTLQLDANGDPTDDFTFTLRPADYAVLPGTYLVQFKGRADLNVHLVNGESFKSADGTLDYGPELNSSSGNEGYDAATNTTTALMIIPALSGNCWPKFRQTDRDGDFGSDGLADQDGVTGLKLMRPLVYGGDTPHNVGELFNRTAVEAWNRLTSNRWNDVNNKKNHEDWPDRVKWEYLSQSSQGMNHEFKVMWCNETGTDLWIQVPHNVDDLYVEKLAKLIRYGSDLSGEPYSSYQSNPVHPGLNPNLRVVVEYSNELPWNTAGQYPQSDWIKDKAVEEVEDNTALGQILGYDGETGSFVLGKRYLAVRIKTISDIFRSVFGDSAMPGTSSSPRVRPVLMYQYDNNNQTARDTLTFLDAYFNNADGQNHVVDPKPVNYYLWGSGGAAYYAGDNRYGIIEGFDWTGADMETTAVPAGQAAINPSDPNWSFSGDAGFYHNATREQVEVVSLGGMITTTDNYNYRGFRFTVGSQPVAVYDFGAYNQGTEEETTVAIYDAETGTKVISRDLPFADQAVGDFAWIKAGTYLSFVQEIKNRPLLLEPGKSYYFLATTSGSYHDDSTVVSSPAGITIDGSAKLWLEEIKDANDKVIETIPHFVDGTTANRSFGPLSLTIATETVKTADQSLDLGFVYDAHSGEQALFIHQTGEAVVNLQIPAAGHYAINYRLAQRRDDLDFDGDGSRTDQWTNPLFIELIDGANVSNITPRSRNNTNPDLDGWEHGDNARKTDTYNGWGTIVFEIDSPRTVQIRFSGTSTADYRTVYLDDFSLSRVSEIENSNIPIKGTAEGQTGSDLWFETIASEWKYAQTYGLEAAVYEAGWFPGGDWDRTPMQVWFSLYSPTIREKEILIQQAMQRAGVRLMMDYTGTIFGMPENKLGEHNDMMRMQAWDEINTSLMVEDANGAGPGILTGVDAQWDFNATASLGEIEEHGGFISWLFVAPESGFYKVQVKTDRPAEYTLFVDGDTPVLSGNTQDTKISNQTGTYLNKGLHAYRLQSKDAAAFKVNSLTIINAADLFPVEGLYVQVGSNQAQLHWDVYEVNNDGYNVYYRAAGADTWIQSNNALVTTESYTVFGLTYGVDYEFMVRAQSGSSKSIDSVIRTANIGDTHQILHYGFETTTSLAEDSSPSGAAHTGVIVGGGLTQTSADSISGSNASSWDGSGSNEIQVSDHPELDGAEALTFSVWIKPDASGLDGQPRALFSKRTASNTDLAYSIFLFNGAKLVVDIPGEKRIYSDTAIAADVWTLVTVVFDGSQEPKQRLKIYLNGELDKEAASENASLPDTIAPLTLGVLNVGYGRAFSGLMDDARIYQAALSGADVAQMYQGLFGLVPDVEPMTGESHYDFENAASLGEDSSGDHSGVAYGPTISLDSSDARSLSASLRIDGNAANRIEVPDSDDFDGGSTLGLAFWIKPDALGVDGNPRGILAKRVGINNEQSYAVYLHGGGKLYVQFAGSATFSYAPPIAANEWTHVALSYDGNAAQSERLKLYINGSLVMTRSNSLSQLPNTASPLHIGTLNANYAQSFSGLIDDVRIISDGLTAAAVAALAEPLIDSTPAITTASLPDATSGSAYSFALTANGGNGELSWTLNSGALPLGLSLSSTGVISGTPQAGTEESYLATYRVSDEDGDAALKELSLQVTPPAGSSALSAGFDTIDLIGAGLIGNALLLSDGSIQVASNGLGFDGNGTGADSLVFPSKVQTGDFYALVNLTALTGPASSRAGLVLRESSSVGARFFAIGSAVGSGYVSQYRDSANASASAEAGVVSNGTLNTDAFPQKWLYLERVGDVVTVFTSSDGNNFTLVDGGTLTLSNLASSVQVGLYAYSGEAGTTCDARFNGFEVETLTSVDVLDSLSARYGFENGSALGQDSIGSHDGTVFGSGITQVSSTGPVGAGATAWNGHNSNRIEIPDNVAFDGAAKLTISAWINPDAVGLDGSPRGIISKRIGFNNQSAYSLFLFTGGNLNVDLAGSSRFSSSAPLPANQWTHVAVVFDGNAAQPDRVKLYINGLLDKTVSNSNTQLPDTTAPVQLGTLNANYSYAFSGLLDDIRLYNGKALDEQEIAIIYQAIE